jgi:hemerythrin
MTLLEWKSEYSVGNASVDHEHQQMINQINAIGVRLGDIPSVKDIESILGEIHADISAHFALEEHLMKLASYAEYEAHKNDHEDLLCEIRELMDSFVWDPETGKELLQRKLSDWFGNHFATFDARLHRKLG